MSCAHWLYLLEVLLLVGAAFIPLDPWPGDVELLAVGLLEPRHNVPASALHVVDQLLKGLVVTKLPVGLDYRPWLGTRPW